MPGSRSWETRHLTFPGASVLNPRLIRSRKPRPTVPLVIVSNNSAPAIRLYLDDDGFTPRATRGSAVSRLRSVATVEMLVSSCEDEMYVDALRAEMERLSSPRVLAIDRAQPSHASQLRASYATSPRRITRRSSPTSWESSARLCDATTGHGKRPCLHPTAPLAPDACCPCSK